MPAYETKILPVEKNEVGSIAQPAVMRQAEDDDLFGDNIEAEIAPDNPAQLKRVREGV